MEVGTSEMPEHEHEDHHTAAHNAGVVMNEIEPSLSGRRPSSDTSGMQGFILCILINFISQGSRLNSSQIAAKV